MHSFIAWLQESGGGNYRGAPLQNWHILLTAIIVIPNLIYYFVSNKKKRMRNKEIKSNNDLDSSG